MADHVPECSQKRCLAACAFSMTVVEAGSTASATAPTIPSSQYAPSSLWTSRSCRAVRRRCRRYVRNGALEGRCSVANQVDGIGHDVDLLNQEPHHRLHRRCCLLLRRRLRTNLRRRLSLATRRCGYFYRWLSYQE
jgi:hypothetical protein